MSSSPVFFLLMQVFPLACIHFQTSKPVFSMSLFSLSFSKGLTLTRIWTSLHFLFFLDEEIIFNFCKCWNKGHLLVFFLIFSYVIVVSCCLVHHIPCLNLRNAFFRFFLFMFDETNQYEPFIYVWYPWRSLSSTWGVLRQFWCFLWCHGRSWLSLAYFSCAE